MSKTITLNLNKLLIIEAVKADTFLTGQIDKAEDAVKNASLAYNEQAGDETYQERKLIRTLRSAVAKFEANLAEFVDSAVVLSVTLLLTLVLMANLQLLLLYLIAIRMVWPVRFLHWQRNTLLM